MFIVEIFFPRFLYSKIPRREIFAEVRVTSLTGVRFIHWPYRARNKTRYFDPVVYQCYIRVRFIAVISPSCRCSLGFELAAFRRNRGQGAMRVATGVLVDCHAWKVLVQIVITRPWKRLTSSSTKNTFTISGDNAESYEERKYRLHRLS